MNRQALIELVHSLVKDKPTAEMVVDRLHDEGVLHIGRGDVSVDQVVETFVDTFGTTKTTRYDRFAAKRLADKYGAKVVCQVIQMLGSQRDQKYAPTVGSITQLETKWVSVFNFLRKQSQEREVVDA